MKSLANWETAAHSRETSQTTPILMATVGDEAPFQLLEAAHKQFLWSISIETISFF